MIELDSKIIGIKNGRKIDFFYFQNSQMNLFRRYLYQDNWIELEFDNELLHKGRFLAYPIISINRIEAFGKNDHIVYFNKKKINKSVYDTLSNLDNTMFLDLEMTMPSYKFRGPGFVTELIQAGLIIFDKDGNELYSYNKYVKPTVNKQLTKRALDFLNITLEEYENLAIPYQEFYNDFKAILDKYNPTIIVYGKNDILVLNDSYRINKCKSLENKTRFINIMKLIKTFYELKNDPGLFKIYECYYDKSDEQEHNALDDSKVTHEVFKAFKDDINTSYFYEKIYNSFVK